MTSLLDAPTLELPHSFRTECATRLDRIDNTLAKLVTQIRIHAARIGGLAHQENFTTSKVTELETHLARVEKRLELRDN